MKKKDLWELSLAFIFYAWFWSIRHLYTMQKNLIFKNSFLRGNDLCFLVEFVWYGPHPQYLKYLREAVFFPLQDYFWLTYETLWVFFFFAMYLFSLLLSALWLCARAMRTRSAHLALGIVAGPTTVPQQLPEPGESGLDLYSEVSG